MFKILSSKRYSQISGDASSLSLCRQERDSAEEKHSQLRMKWFALEEEFEKTQSERDELKKEVDRLNEILNRAAEDNSVRLVISPDMEMVTPIIAYREDAFESLFQSGRLTDAQQDAPEAIQLALLAVASEGLNQLLEAFEDPIED